MAARQTLLASFIEVLTGRALVFSVCTAIQYWLFNDWSPVEKFKCVTLTVVESLGLSALFVFGVSLGLNFIVRRVATRL
jgi:hypothetical protein|tara:strand:- start:276 stop:512 length:237 start_codon:yes stop_codon:yes gene_type:complete